MQPQNGFIDAVPRSVLFAFYFLFVATESFMKENAFTKNQLWDRNEEYVFKQVVHAYLNTNS